MAQRGVPSPNKDAGGSSACALSRWSIQGKGANKRCSHLVKACLVRLIAKRGEPFEGKYRREAPIQQRCIAATLQENGCKVTGKTGMLKNSVHNASPGECAARMPSLIARGNRG